MVNMSCSSSTTDSAGQADVVGVGTEGMDVFSPLINTADVEGFAVELGVATSGADVARVACDLVSWRLRVQERHI